MKKIVISTVFLLTSLNQIAQNNEVPKFRTFFDAGFFQSTFKPASNDGNYLSGGFGYKINNEFWLNLTLIKISGTGEFEQNPFFLNNETNYNNTLIIPNFSKDWKLINDLYIGGALGCALIFEKVLIPTVIAVDQNDIIGIDFNNEGEPFNFGLYGELAIKYELIKNLNLSLYAKSFLPMNLTPDTLLLGVGIEIKL